MGETVRGTRGWTGMFIAFWLCAACLLVPATVSADQPTSIAERATHYDHSKFSVSGINAFAINPSGQILAACGTGPGMIKILDPDGKVIREWSVDFRPEAINSTPSGEILVGGIGQLRRFNAAGELLQESEAPHVAALKTNNKKLREEVISNLKAQQEMMSGAGLEGLIPQYQKMLEDLEKRQKTEKLNASEEQILKVLPDHIAQLERQVAEHKKAQAGKPEQPAGPTEAEIQEGIKNTIAQKSRIASISTDGSSVFIATPSTSGWGYSVWKMTDEFSDPVEIVQDLRGCCGHMDVQCCENGVYVAENSRHRVVCYDPQGKEQLTWGQSDRTGLKGFTSCCNPMNVCFNSQGDVYTAESTTGRIKRFDKEGNFLDFVGDVKLVPGCKNVSIAVSPDMSRVYMLDITRGHVVIMAKHEGERPAVSGNEFSHKASANPISNMINRLVPTSSGR